MKNTLKIITLVAFAIPTLVNAADQSSEWNTSMKVGLGAKSMADSRLSYDEQDSVGLWLNFKPADANYSLSIAAFGSGNDYEKRQTEEFTSELHLGAKYHLDIGAFKPYLGAGVSFGFVERTTYNSNSKTMSDDTATGYYWAAGFDYEISSSYSLGIDFRQSEYDVDLHDDLTSVDAGSKQVSITLGYKF